jgi:hypothetical protein
MFSAPAAPAPAAIAKIAIKPGSGSRRTGAIINPTNAVNSASAITRGLAKLMKWGSRSNQPDRDVGRRRDIEIAMLFMLVPQAESCSVKPPAPNRWGLRLSRYLSRWAARA